VVVSLPDTAFWRIVLAAPPVLCLLIAFCLAWKRWRKEGRPGWQRLCVLSWRYIAAVPMCMLTAALLVTEPLGHMLEARGVRSAWIWALAAGVGAFVSLLGFMEGWIDARRNGNTPGARGR
jgi:hypothetical protein